MEHKIHRDANVLYAVPEVVFDENRPLYREEYPILKKAGNAIRMAKLAIDNEDPMVEECLFHVQQCLEMSLRAFRAFHLQPIMKTHKLPLLRQLCGKIEPEIKQIERFSSHAARRIAQYYWLRYHRDIKIPVDIAGVEAEIDIADRVYRFIRNYIETREPPTEPAIVPEPQEREDSDDE